jgi:glyoxylase-like metal-dependent hydrolase (beta-lactamase superfamily II)
MPRVARPILSALAILISGPAAGQQPPAAPTPDHHERPSEEVFRVVPLASGVHVLYGRGGNVGFFVGPEAVVVIDSQFKDLAPGIIAQIRKVTDKPIKFLLNTHHHGDHVGGNDVFRQFAMIVAHDNVRRHMLASPQEIQRDFPARIEEAKKRGNAEAAKRLEEQLAWARTVKIEQIAAPLLTFDSEFRIHMGDETIQVWHLPPAHTDGDSVVYFEKAKVLHMGDDFFHRVIPFIDTAHGGSPRGYLSAIDRAMARVPPDVRVIPGHGEVTDLTGLKGFRQYIADLIEAARRAKTAGRSRDQFLADAELPAYKDYSGYKDRFKANAQAAYDEVK